ncbi:glycoside hydrolase family 43 protein [Brevundimonas sp.]|uniref:glycoside hydrolase family 43 protein n=1 Tax=Brevundimonas sp. TaxID=1871086 RepID=UPI002AB88AF1|nr:glycoside hydrolase family 43 protein [Brevundimonas sp.]MDZ4365311.1 glycoside hydrolase family 43 protein [Brevundimonas sp.]
MSIEVDRRRFSLGVGALAMAGSGCASVGSPADDTLLLLSYFTGVDEGRAGLKLAVSEDGFTYRALREGTGFLVPTVGENRLMRDPSISLGPDGRYHMVWTTDWFGPVIGYASSADLIEWSPQKALPVMADFPGVRNSWAPEMIWDAAAGHWVIVWSSSVAGRFGATDQTGFDGLEHRPYVTTTRDFETFTPTRLLFDPGFNCIDFTWLRLNDGSLQLIFKDETHQPTLKRWLVHAQASAPAGPFGPVSEPFAQSWTEGPTAIAFQDGYLIYFDCYEDHRFGARFTRDLVTFEDVSDRVVFPNDVRHGTVIRVPRSLAQRLA